MKWPGISLKTMMFGVAILAADLGFFSHLDPALWRLGEVELVLIGLLPMANIITLGLPRLLWLGLPRLLRRARRTPFSVGFQITSWVATLAMVVVCIFQLEAILGCLTYFEPPAQIPLPRYVDYKTVGPPIEAPVGFLESWWNTLSDSIHLENWFDMIQLMAFFSLPPLLVSLAGGLITRFVVLRQARARNNAVRTADPTI